MANSLTEKKETFSMFLTSGAIKNKVNEIVGSKDGTRFMTQILSAVTTNPDLQRCNFMSILNCAFLGESLKLSPSPQLGQYYMLPFDKKEKGVVVATNATFVLGIKGYKQLAMRTGQYLDIDAMEIREGEYKGRDKYTGKPIFEFIEDDEIRESLPIIGYMAYFELLNGFRKVIYWSVTKVEKHADKYSAAFHLDKYRLLQDGKIPQNELWKYSSYWYVSFPNMAMKTLLRNILSQWGILSIEMQMAIEKDECFIDDTGQVEYVDSVPDVDIPQIEQKDPDTVCPVEIVHEDSDIPKFKETK
jgi:recombination protein RecT